MYMAPSIYIVVMPVSACCLQKWITAMASGRMCKCREVAEKGAAEFTADKTRNLIVRLQFNVIRAGLRRINLAYSRISLADVATRLGDFHFRRTSSSCIGLIFTGKCIP